MIHLIIKAKSLADAQAAAHSRDLKVFCLRSYSENEVLATCKDEADSRVRKWYHEQRTGTGYPQGTLMHFAQLEPSS